MQSNRYRSFAALLFLIALLLAPATLHSQSKPTGKDLVMGGLKCGMTKTEVLKLLKEPNRKEDSGFNVVWTYSNPSMEVTLDDRPDHSKKLPEPVVSVLTTRSSGTTVTVDGKKIKVGSKISDVESILGKAHETDVVVFDTEYLWYNKALSVLADMNGKIYSISLWFKKAK